MPASPELVGIDVGGTFTDFVWLVDGNLHVQKVSTTPEDQSIAIVQGLEQLGVAPDAAVLHGTTVATNALLERRGARTALLTTQGFGDVLVIGRQNRPHLYQLSQTRPPDLIPQAWRYEIAERLDANGHVLISLDTETLVILAQSLEAAGIESLAIVFLFSFQNPAHEIESARVLSEYLPDLPLSLSNEILPEHREYERTATTVINAYVQPLVRRYFSRLETALGQRSVQVMQSNGGMSGLAHASQHAARLVLSGPAGGVVGAFASAQQALDTPTPAILTFDMGGTSTDVALCPGFLPRSSESTIANLPLRVPTTDIHTVGAGGGSIAYVDSGGVLRVGPESAGAHPGPVCYGRGGTQPTVTDANLVLGRLSIRHFMGGTPTEVAQNRATARKAITNLSEPLGLSVEETALGIVSVANAAMERALRRVSVERGFDPRTYVLVPFGGAGPLHACDLADSLAISRVLLVPHPGVLSALGLLLADVVYDNTQALLIPMASLFNNLAPLSEAVTHGASAVRETFAREHHMEPTIEATLDIRYMGQSYELSVPLHLPSSKETLAAAIKDFHELHFQRYGHAHQEAATEAVALRMRGVLPGTQITFPSEPATIADINIALQGTQSVWFDTEGPVETPCYDRASLHHGHYLHGPAILYQYDTTAVVPPGWLARVDARRNVWIEKR